MKWFLSIFFCAIFVLSLVLGVNFAYAVLFPIRYQNEVQLASEMFDVEKATIYSIINIESRFKKDVISSKGAVGLMQIMPSTAQEFAKKAGLEKFELKNPKDNILIGTAYFSYLTEKFNDTKLALCAYNAGPSNVNFWLSKQEYSTDGLTLSKIPFTETENYIKKFEQNHNFYSKKIGGDNRS